MAQRLSRSLDGSIYPKIFKLLRVTGWNERSGNTLDRAKNNKRVDKKEIRKKTLPFVGRDTIEINGFKKR